jgi:hypothetical protein
MPRFNIRTLGILVAVMATFLGTLSAARRGPLTALIALVMYIALIYLWIRYGPKVEQPP